MVYCRCSIHGLLFWCQLKPPDGTSCAGLNIEFPPVWILEWLVHYYIYFKNTSQSIDSSQLQLWFPMPCSLMAWLPTTQFFQNDCSLPQASISNNRILLSTIVCSFHASSVHNKFFCNQLCWLSLFMRNHVLVYFYLVVNGGCVFIYHGEVSTHSPLGPVVLGCA